MPISGDLDQRRRSKRAHACHASCVKKRIGGCVGKRFSAGSAEPSYLTSHYYTRPPHPLQLVIPFVNFNDELIRRAR